MPIDAVIAGGGVIGLAVAWRCAERGLRVTVADPAPGAGASWTAAGMLAPVTELGYEGRELLDLNLAAARRWPSFAAELGDAAGSAVGLRECGTVAAAWDAADLAGLRDLAAFHASLGLRSEVLTGRELRTIEPALAAGLPGGLLAAGDHQVDNRSLVRALRAVVARLGVDVIPARVTRIAGTAGGTEVTLDTGDRLAAGVVVVAAGSWSGGIDGLPDPPPVRPVKGQTLRLRRPPGLLGHVVRGSVRGNPVYVVPRTDGELVVGASSEEAGFDLRPRAGAVYELLRDAQTLVPELSEAEFVEVSTGVRPGTPDNAPLLGRSATDGVLYATGHYRNGILLAPVTADAIADLITTGRTPDLVTPFDPARFQARTEARTQGGPS